jgi:hypothetical protein
VALGDVPTPTVLSLFLCTACHSTTRGKRRRVAASALQKARAEIEKCQYWLLLALTSTACSVPKFEFVTNPIQAESHCSDLISDQGETGVDCGGTCPGCAAGGSCLVNNDCAGNPCVANVCQAPSCTDGVESGSEQTLIAEAVIARRAQPASGA